MKMIHRSRPAVTIADIRAAVDTPACTGLTPLPKPRATGGRRDTEYIGCRSTRSTSFPKEVDVVVDDEPGDVVVAAIVGAARTGKIGDGKSG